MYTLQNVTNDGVVITPHLKGFWCYANFNINSATGMVSIGSGYTAFDYSADSNMFNQTAPVAPPLDNVIRNYNLIDNGTPQTLNLNNASAVRNYKAEYVNEVRQLYLLKFDNMTQPANWFGDVAYTPQFKEPVQNDNGEPFLPRTLVYKEGQPPRYVFSGHTEENNNGTATVILILPFLNSSFFKHILSIAQTPAGVPQDDNDGKPVPLPPLQLTTGAGGGWIYGGANALPFPGAVNGFIMVCQGSFKAMDLNLSLAGWRPGGSLIQNDQAILQELVSITHNSTRFTRNAETVDVTVEDAVHPGSPDGPIEIVYLGNLNSNGPVPSVL
ncbi:hypothetical protein [Candidatus Parabeggiatoa sp. HSG14]|uniref:hypothetical protein n=1 Tax=Candidatus Parabeggiatoa sp. HSG14 TaxID=3055593 RepID=UPI0025A840C1|nr:hypothetical protein [Thiotrichales bacterium HSG14]